MTHDFKKNNIERIVVRGTNWVGDAVMGVPALRELRQVFPQAHISLVVRPWAEGLFADTTFVDSILVFDRRGVMSVIDQVRCWREQKFDLAVLFQNAFEAALIPFMAQIPIRVGYATDHRRLLLTHPLQLPEKREQEHEVFYYLNIIKELARIVGGGPTVAPPECLLQVSETRQIAAVEKLVSIGARQNTLPSPFAPDR